MNEIELVNNTGHFDHHKGKIMNNEFEGKLQTKKSGHP